MSTTAAWYWIALTILAFGLNNEYQNDRFPEMSRATARTATVVSELGTRAEQSLASMREEMRADAWILVAHPELAFSTLEARSTEQFMARQAQLDRNREKLERMRASLEGVQANLPSLRQNLRLHSVAGRRTVMVCPRTGQRIEIDMPDLSDLESQLQHAQVVVDSF